METNPVDEACRVLAEIGWVQAQDDDFWNTGIMTLEHPDSASTIEIAVAES